MIQRGNVQCKFWIFLVTLQFGCQTIAMEVEEDTEERVFIGSHKLQKDQTVRDLNESVMKILNPAVEFLRVEPESNSIGGIAGYLIGRGPGTESRSSALVIEDDSNNDSNEETVLMRLVEGCDGRTQVNDNLEYPYRCFCYLEMRFRASGGSGTGVLIGPQHVLTAAHCVYSKSMKEWATELTVTCGRKGHERPFGQRKAVRLCIPKEYLYDKDFDEFDIALIVLDQPVDATVGALGCLFSSDISLYKQALNITGYPADMKGQTLWTMASAIESQAGRIVEAQGNKIYYQIDTAPGQSGSPVWSFFNLTHRGQNSKNLTPMIIGVHTHGETRKGQGNSGVLLTEDKFRLIMNWMAMSGKVDEQPKSPEGRFLRRPLPSLPLNVTEPQQAVLDPLINEQDAEGKTALHRAIKNNMPDRVRELLEQGAAVDVFDIKGQTPLHCAVSDNLNEIVLLLIDHHADVMAIDRHGKTALYIAVCKGAHVLVNLLTARGARIQDDEKIRHGWNGLVGELFWTTLHAAAYLGNEGIIKLLIAKTSNVNVRDESGRTPLHVAVSRLIDVKMHQSADNRDYIEHKHQIGIIRRLLAHGAQVDSVDMFGITPLHLAAEQGCPEVVALLFEKYATVNAVTSAQAGGRTPLHTAIRAFRLPGRGHDGHKQVIKMLMERGADPELQDSDNKNALDLAHYTEEILELFKEYTSLKTRALQALRGLKDRK